MFWTFDKTNILPNTTVNHSVRSLLIICFCLFCIHSFGQGRNERLVQDTVRVQMTAPEIDLKPVFIPIPKKALLYSLVLPGAGQIYNRRYWKLPLVAAAYGGLIYAFDFNSTGLKRWRTAYELRVDGDETTIDEFDGFLTDSAIRSRRDYFKKNLELTYMAAIVVHALNGIEAYVDAHLRNFDISEDLSFQIRPTFENNLNGSQTGLGVFFSF